MEAKEQSTGEGRETPSSFFLQDEYRFGPPLAAMAAPRSAEEYATKIADFVEQWKWLYGTSPLLKSWQTSFSSPHLHLILAC